jgi:hypothetical protein
MGIGSSPTTATIEEALRICMRRDHLRRTPASAASGHDTATRARAPAARTASESVAMSYAP